MPSSPVALFVYDSLSFPRMRRTGNLLAKQDNKCDRSCQHAFTDPNAAAVPVGLSRPRAQKGCLKAALTVPKTG